MKIHHQKLQPTVESQAITITNNKPDEPSSCDTYPDPIQQLSQQQPSLPSSLQSASTDVPKKCRPGFTSATPPPALTQYIKAPWPFLADRAHVAGNDIAMPPQPAPEPDPNNDGIVPIERDKFAFYHATGTSAPRINHSPSTVQRIGTQSNQLSTHDTRPQHIPFLIMKNFGPPTTINITYTVPGTFHNPPNDSSQITPA